MLNERSLAFNSCMKNTATDSAIPWKFKTTKPLTELAFLSQATGFKIKPSTTTTFLYVKNIKNERILPKMTAAQFGSLKDAISKSSAAIADKKNFICGKNNNNNKLHSCIINNKSYINSCLVNNHIQNQTITNKEGMINSITLSCNQPQQTKEQNHHKLQQLTLDMSNSQVKEERLSPSTNGDPKNPFSRSRSTTPSSFNGTSPQNSIHSSSSEKISQLPSNLSTNPLNCFHQTTEPDRLENLRGSPPVIVSPNTRVASDFSKLNYSDFMRSLAAKYNNENPNEKIKLNLLFEVSNKNRPQKRSLTDVQIKGFTPKPSAPISEELSNPTTASLPPVEPMSVTGIVGGEISIKLPEHKTSTAVLEDGSAHTSDVSQYITPFVCNLPGVVPPLVDMSSTQALITLARISKEIEIQNILSISPQNPERLEEKTLHISSPSLNIALQQAAQFISPTLLYSVQLQQKSKDASQSSHALLKMSKSAILNKTLAKINSTEAYKVHISPLDLTSQPPSAKRFKAESTSSQGSSDTNMPLCEKRTSSSSLSPSLLNDVSLDASTNAFLAPTSTTEAAAIPATPITVTSSTSAISTNAPIIPAFQCQAQSEELISWTVDDVCSFVSSIDICAEYAKSFRDQCIDGSGLPLLTEDHLVHSLGMKLGPALKLRSILAKKLGGPCPCAACVTHVQKVLALQASGITPITAIDHTTSSNIEGSTPPVGGKEEKCGCNKKYGKTTASPTCSNNNDSEKCTIMDEIKENTRRNNDSLTIKDTELLPSLPI